MSSNALAVSIRNLSKHYLISNGSGTPTTAAEAIMSRFKKSKNAGGKSFWALDDVSFDVREGEVVGLIGHNGAGKSTLFKILSRITEPTQGQINLYGRVGSLLEVGTGFHPELTGRENIYLNGAILGMSRAEINAQFENIIDFAEIGDFLDTPVKRYSSGMYVRLAFAVAAHLNPEILIVDEVLAVGDAAFQQKCLGKMHDVAEQEGRTVLFVSHNMMAVQSLCSRVIWMDHGRVREDGPPLAIISKYAQSSLTALTSQEWPEQDTAPGNDQVRLRRVCVRPEGGSAEDLITIHTPFSLEFEYWNLEPNAHLNLSLHIVDESGQTVFNTVPLREPVWHGRAFPTGLFRSTCHVPGDLMNDGTYRVLILVVKDKSEVIYRHEDAVVFSIIDPTIRDSAWLEKWHGVMRPGLDWTTEQLEASLPSDSQLTAQNA